MRQIYLDYNATTPIAPSVLEAMQPFFTEHYGNPSSSHVLGRACEEAISDARQRVAGLLGCDADEVIFTSCGTESNNLALKGVLLRNKPDEGGHLVITTIEHPAVSEPARFLANWGYDVTVVRCDPRGVVDPGEIEKSLRPDTLLVSVMHANNETGVIQPIREIGKICRRRDVLLHTDAAQSIGKIRVQVDELGVDLLTIAGHKLYAPKGIGALYVRRGTRLAVVQHGAGHEGGRRAGTENVPYIVGLGKASVLASKAVSEIGPRLESLRDRLWQQLREGIGAKLSLNGEGTVRLPNTLNVNFPGVAGHELLAEASELCASTGAACHSGATHISATLAAMGVPVETARGAVRLSLGWYTSQDEIDRAASLLINAWERISPSPSGRGPG
jgi:cysteine desulfurase